MLGEGQIVSRKRKAIVGLAGLALAGGACLGGVAAAPVAGAASQACGSSCVSMYNQKFGSADVSAVSGGSAATGQAVILAGAGPTITEDWAESVQGKVSDFAAAGLINAALAVPYANDQVVEITYAPGGVYSGFCLAVASVPSQNKRVTLQPCGVSANSLWILDTAAASGGYVPLISGSGTKYPAPYVLTAVQAGGDFTTQALQFNSAGVVAKDQMWQLIFGVLTATVAIPAHPAGTNPGVAPNWAGYQATATDARYASAQLVQPTISCAANNSSSDVAIWVGIGSKQILAGLLGGGKTLAQVGTWAFCYKGKAGYFMFWETVGRSASEGGSQLEPVWAGPSPLAVPSACSNPPPTSSENEFLAYLVDNNCTESLAPGDRLNLVTEVSAGQWADLFVYNSRTKFQLNTTQTFTGVEANAANWIAESPSVNGSYSPLANFGTVTFSNCEVVSGNTFLPINGLSNANIFMYGILPFIFPIRATATALTPGGTQFSVTWDHS